MWTHDWNKSHPCSRHAPSGVGTNISCGWNKSTPGPLRSLLPNGGRFYHWGYSSRPRLTINISVLRCLNFKVFGALMTREQQINPRMAPVKAWDCLRRRAEEPRCRSRGTAITYYKIKFKNRYKGKELKSNTAASRFICERFNRSHSKAIALKKFYAAASKAVSVINVKKGRAGALCIRRSSAVGQYKVQSGTSSSCCWQ